MSDAGDRAGRELPPALETVSFDPHLVVLFGATGNLSRRKLLPALYRLMRRRDFKDETHLLGVGRSDYDAESFRQFARQGIVESGIDEEEARAWCADNLSYFRLDGSYEDLASTLRRLEEERDLTGNRAFYLAIPPAVFDETVEGIAKAGLNSGPGWTRVVVEKPFGTDLASACRLNALLHRWFDESQIYRIDHYLAKETVQNLLVFRFANPLFELAWNRDRIASVQITVAETVGLDARVGYFDQAGIVRDIIQNHAMQLFSLVAMEPPVRLAASDIRDEKVKALRAVVPVSGEAIVRGRYERGEVGGEEVEGYLDEEGVPPSSRTETFAALRVEIDNWRWRGVPFYLRAGKRMSRRLTQIAVRFKEPPVHLFPQDIGQPGSASNVLYVTLQPDEGFDLMFDVKTPGEGMRLRTLPLSFRYEDAFGPLPEAYETLLADILAGDQTLFVRADEAEEAWRILGGAIDTGAIPEPYRAGTWGPPAADRLLENGEQWTVRLPRG